MEGKIYVGLQCGMIVSVKLKIERLEPLFHFQAYENQVCSLMLLQSNPLTFITSTSSQSNYLRRSSQDYTAIKHPEVAQSDSCDSIKSSLEFPGLTNNKVESNPHTNRMILLSIGQDFKGIFGSHQNIPSKLLLPRLSNSSSSSMTNSKKCTKSSFHLLVWSTEV